MKGEKGWNCLKEVKQTEMGSLLMANQIKWKWWWEWIWEEAKKKSMIRGWACHAMNTSNWWGRRRPDITTSWKESNIPLVFLWSSTSRVLFLSYSTASAGCFLNGFPLILSLDSWLYSVFEQLLQMKQEFNLLCLSLVHQTSITKILFFLNEITRTSKGEASHVECLQEFGWNKTGSKNKRSGKSTGQKEKDDKE